MEKELDFIAERIEKYIEDTKKITATPGKGVTRLPFTLESKRCVHYLEKQMSQMGLDVIEDASGAVIGILKGKSPERLMIGSHIDTVLEAGMFDGVAGLESVRIIKEQEIPHKRDICVWVYTSEESTRFQMGCIGSRTMAGHLSQEELAYVKDKDGITLEELLLKRGFCLDQFDQIPKKRVRCMLL